MIKSADAGHEAVRAGFRTSAKGGVVLDVVAGDVVTPAASEDEPRPRAPWADVVASAVIARLVVLLALGLSALIRHGVEQRHHLVLRSDNLLGWDAAWYLRIAEHGYSGMPKAVTRFFPVFPLLVRALSVPLLGHTAAAALLLANAAAVAYVVLLHRLALLEGLGEVAATRIIWIAAFTPAAFVLVMGYSESLYGCEIVGCLIAVRTRHWLSAAALGALAGATRPTGVVLAVFVLVEAIRHVSEVGVRELLGRLVAVVAPAAGLAAYLSWAAARFGDWLTPLRVQTQQGLRGGVLVNPLNEAARVIEHAVSGARIAPVVHLPWVAVVLVLVVVVVRRLPASYSIFAVCSVVLAVTAQEFSSFERYAASCVPLLLAAATLRVPRAYAAGILGLAGALLFGTAVMAFMHMYVP